MHKHVMPKELDKNSRVLFFGKKKDQFSVEAFEFLKKKFPKSKKILTDNKIGEKIKINYQKFDSIVIFKTKLIFTKNQLKKVKGLKINFHTSLPKYPGSNGVNYLIYNSDKYFGITVHEVNEKVDNGRIIYVEKERVKKNHLYIPKLLKLIYELQTKVFKKIILNISNDNFFIKNSQKKYSHYKWNKKTYRYSDFEKIKLIKLGMSKNKLDSVIRSTAYGDHKPHIIFHRKKFILNI